MLAAGALLGWLAASGRLAPLSHAQDKPGQASPKGGAGLSSILPPPEAPFDGVIGRTYKDSVPSKIPVVKAPAGAPNVLVILIDDCGFGQWGTFGGQIPTPNLDRLARNGLKYTRFHTTALCSPTRAALLTGRNHHSCATGNITEVGTSFPGYTGQIPKSCAMVSEVVRQNGYSTAWFGKNHNIPDWETSLSGPFDRWPILQGFDHFYGFVGGEANQWAPALYDGTTPVAMEVPKGREENYTLNEDLANKAIDYVRRQKSVTPDRPFFVYYAPGATHAPHHVPREWMAKFKGKFDQGWDSYREETFQRQLKLGVITPESSPQSHLFSANSVARARHVVPLAVEDARQQLGVGPTRLPPGISEVRDLGQVIAGLAPLAVRPVTPDTAPLEQGTRGNGVRRLSRLAVDAAGGSPGRILGQFVELPLQLAQLFLQAA
jgi:arylsulfatase